MSKFLNERYASFDAYVPGEQPQDKKYIKLNTNEMPYPPSEKVIAAASAAAETLNLYPDPSGEALKKTLADAYGVKSENIFISNGSDEILSFSFMALFDKGVSFADITYGFYKVYAELYGVNANILPLKDDFSIDVNDYIGAENAVIANPNAPTGLVLSCDEIEAIVKSAKGVVIVDEAYAEFGEVSCIELTKKYDNLMIVRTYSKSYAMAGARLGFAIANKALIDDLEKIKFSTNPYNINRMTMAAGIATIEDKGYYDECVRKVREAREYTAKELRRLGFELNDSGANFVFARKPGYDGEKLYLELKANGILVRHFSTERIKDYLRISIGTPEQMQKLIAVTESIINA